MENARTVLRRDTRFPTEIKAQMTFGNQPFDVVIRDISQHGILMDGAFLPPAGSRIGIRAAGLDAIGLMVWRGEGQCGVLLKRGINPMAVVRANHAPAQRGPIIITQHENRHLAVL